MARCEKSPRSLRELRVAKPSVLSAFPLRRGELHPANPSCSVFLPHDQSEKAERVLCLDLVAGAGLEPTIRHGESAAADLRVMSPTSYFAAANSTPRHS